VWQLGGKRWGSSASVERLSVSGWRQAAAAADSVADKVLLVLLLLLLLLLLRQEAAPAAGGSATGSGGRVPPSAGCARQPTLSAAHECPPGDSTFISRQHTDKPQPCCCPQQAGRQAPQARRT
jgi:hypothetical protein